MKKIVYLFIAFNFLLSCSVKWKKENSQKKSQGLQAQSHNKAEKIFSKPSNWADDYYQDTRFVVSNPKVVENYQQIIKICKGSEFKFVTGYQFKLPSPVKYKGEQIHIVTKSGFKKKIYISRGACREISLFLGKVKDQGQQLRSSIKSMQLAYIYNKGTYLLEMTFNTPYSDVKFHVK